MRIRSAPVAGCPILAFFARLGGDTAGATFVRSTLPTLNRRRTRPSQSTRTRSRGGLQFEDPATRRFIGNLGISPHDCSERESVLAHFVYDSRYPQFEHRNVRIGTSCFLSTLYAPHQLF